MRSHVGNTTGKRTETETAAAWFHEHPASGIKRRGRNGFYKTAPPGCGLKLHEELESISATGNRFKVNSGAWSGNRSTTLCPRSGLNTVDACFLGHSAQPGTNVWLVQPSEMTPGRGTPGQGWQVSDSEWDSLTEKMHPQSCVTF